MKKITFLVTVFSVIFATHNSFGQLVTSSADDGSDGTLRKEIMDTPANGIVTFVGVTTVNLTSQIPIDKNLIITGLSRAVTIDGGGVGRIFNVTDGNLVLNNLILTNGLADDGGAIYIANANVAINDCVIKNNIANGSSGSGGGVYNDVGGVLIVTNSEISGNRANRAGGGIEDNSGPGLTITLVNVKLDNNNAGVAPATAAPGNGGGLHITGAGDVSIVGGTSSGNKAAKEGGALWNGSGTMTIDGTLISNNQALGNATGGGGIFNNGNGTIAIRNSTVLTGNIASGETPGGRGGAIFNNTAGVLNLQKGLVIEGNYASRAGGAIEDASGGTLDLNEITFTGNAAGVDIGLGNTITANPGNGGALHLSGSTNVNSVGSVVTDNKAAQEGGGFWNNMGTMSIDSSSFQNNEALGNDATDGGGGIFNNGGTLDIKNASQLLYNEATGTSGSGGGLFSIAGSVTIDYSWVAYNKSNRAGGGIELVDGTLMLSRVTLDFNTTGASPGNGGGLHITGSANATLSEGTVKGNIASREGGGLWNGTGTMTVNNVVIDGNDAQGAAADDGGGGIFNNGGTLIVQNGTSISNNMASGTSGSGGGLHSTGGEVTMMGVIVTDNIANRAGGGIELAGGTLNLNQVTLDMNNAGVAPAVAAPGSGGGLHVSGSATTNIVGGTTNNNIAANEGGGLWNGSGMMTVSNHEIDGNTASGNDMVTAGAAGGGGIYNEGGTLDLLGSTMIKNNNADGAQSTGGGILNAAGTLMANGITIMNNQSNRAGGGIETNGGGAVTLTNVNLDSNATGVVTGTGAPGNGGGLHVSGNSAVTVMGGTTNNNMAANEGGGLWNGSGMMTVSNHEIDGNTASGNDMVTAGAAGGGGIYNEGGTLDLSGSTMIKNNNADGAQSTGGGILNAAGTLMANGISIMNNQSNRAGGGIETNSGGAVTLTNVNLDSNATGVVTGTGAPGNGGGLHVSGNSAITVMGGTVNMNTAASEGGGLWNGAGILTVDGATIDGNIASGTAADNGGGGIYALNGGTVNLINGATVSNNVANGTSGSGGGILVDVDANLNSTDATITGNSANRAGGGIEIVGGLGLVSLMNTNLDMNNAGVSPAVAAPGNGGGLHITNAQDITITGGTANGNTAAREGGALWNSIGVMTVDNVLIDSNSALGAAADDGGAGIFNNGGTLNIVNGTMISGNLSTGASASGGGLLSTAGDVTVIDSFFESNSANRAGGAIELIDGNLTFTNSIVLNNDVNGTAGTPAPGNGGGFHVTGMSGTIIFDTSTITGNSAFNEGGGLWNQGGTTMTVSNSTLNGNRSGEGGAIYNNTGAMTSVMTSTISGNTASVSGGGLSNNGASLDLNAVTVAMNTAGLGGGIDAVTNVSLTNTIVALNTAGSGADVSGVLTSNDYNLIGADDLNAFTAQANDLEGVDPMLGPLQDNGGVTLTHQLLDGSPAFDAGAPDDSFADQIGQMVFGASRDIGAYEAQVTLTIDEFNEVSVLKIYPNPTKGQFSIVIDSAVTGAVEVQIVSITGKVVQKLAIGNGMNALDISGMSSGMYVVNVKTEKGASTHKLILE